MKKQIYLLMLIGLTLSISFISCTKTTKEDDAPALKIKTPTQAVNLKNTTWKSGEIILSFTDTICTQNDNQYHRTYNYIQTKDSLYLTKIKCVYLLDNSEVGLNNKYKPYTITNDTLKFDNVVYIK